MNNLDNVELGKIKKETGGSDQEIRAKKNKGRGFLAGLLLGTLLSVLLLSAAYVGSGVYRSYKLGALAKAVSAQGISQESVVNADVLRKLVAIEELIGTHYYKDDITKEEFENGLYKGLVTALGDPYAEYYSPDELDATMNKIEGVSYGIGAYISLDEEAQIAMISGVIEESPAQEAGLREGDLLIKVDDKSTQGLSIQEVVALVKGKENTTVHLSVYREGELDYLEFDIQRRKLIEAVTVVSTMLEDDIGYLKIREFDDITLDQYTEAIAVLKESGMKGLVLDLRSNPGGNMNTVTEIARKLLPEGLIVYTEDKSGKRTEYSCDGSGELQMPLVVLINQYSASASEILAGAIQDYGKGTLIGTTTFGKGIVQRIFTLSDETAVKLTVSSYYTPAGRNIDGIGITPDIELEFDSDGYYDEGKDNQLDRAIEVLLGQM